MDVQMHGMNRLEATQLIRAFEAREQRARLPIIGMTAAGDRERCLATGMDNYIAKPFNPEQLEKALRNAIKAGRQSRRCSLLSEPTKKA